MTARMRADKRGRRSQETQDLFSSTLNPVYRAVAILFATGAVTSAHAAPINLSGVAAQVSAARNQAVANGLPAIGVSPQQALRASQSSIQNLAHTVQTLAAQIAAQQSAAQAAAATVSNVPNGLAPGGLQVAPGASADPNNPVLWINANLPQQTTNADGSITVDVKQNAQNAVLTWQTMNVGSRTTLNFDQSTGTQSNGTNNWVVLNRIQDPSGAPSQIFGHITAQGSVYVINRNGILFGAGSQVNVHSLIASSLDLLNKNDDPIQTPGDIASSNQQFLSLVGGAAGGLAPLEAGQNTANGGSTLPNEVLGLGNIVYVSSPSEYATPGSIVVSPGATINTHSNGTASDGGVVLLAAPTLTNAGAITADDGQIVLAAGVGVGFIATSDPAILKPIVTGAVKVGTAQESANALVDITPVGTLTNTGIVQSSRGNINLLGTMVNQNGAVAVTTSVNVPGAIQIAAGDEYVANTPTGGAYTNGVVPGTNSNPERAGAVILGNGSVVAALPDKDGQTATSTPGVTFTPGSIDIGGGSVWLQGGALIEAPGSTVKIAALTQGSTGTNYVRVPGDTSVAGRVYVDAGASIDVSGLANVELPVSDTLLTVPLVGLNELANSPLLRGGVLFDMKNVIVDSTLSGTNPDGLQWVGSPILNLSGAVALMPRTIDQLLINGGTVELAGDQVITAAGSSLYLNGGYVHYLGGTVNTTRLIDASGAVVPIGDANPYDTFVGVAGQFIESHPRWNVTKTWYNPLLAGNTYEDDFIVGGNAGTLSVFAVSAMVLDGNVSAQAFGGTKQTQGNALPSGGTFNLGTDFASAYLAGSFPNVTGDFRTILLQGSAPDLNSISPGFSATTQFDPTALGALSSTDPNNVLATTVVPVNTLTNGGFSNVNIQSDKNKGNSIIVTAGSELSVQAGGSIVLNAPNAAVTIDGALIAPSGSISISAGKDITVGSGGTLSAAGQWINNDTTVASGTTQGGSEYINGGSVSLTTGSTFQGSILLEPGSVIDVSSGGEMLANGQLLMQNGIPEGKGGSVSLVTYNDAYTADGTVLPSTMPTQGHILLDGSIDSFGFSGGGTLTLQALGIQIGGDASTAPSWSVVLPADFFARQGFGNYVLNALYDATVEPGTIVALTQQNLIPDTSALRQTVTGSDIHAGSLTNLGTIDAYDRQPTSLLLSAGTYLTWKTQSNTTANYSPAVTGAVTLGDGAAIVGDAGASITLASPAQVTVLGSLIAPGGSITLSADSGASAIAQPSGQPPTGQTAVTSDTKSVWLGQNAVLDVSGVALTNPIPAAVRIGTQRAVPDEGKVLAGGSVTISDDSGFIVAQAGSRIDVSGTSAVFDEPASVGGYAPQQVWSDAGSITINASSGLALDATLVGHGGAPQANGGTLSLIGVNQGGSAYSITSKATTALPGAKAFILQQSGDLATGDVLGQSLGTPTGVLQFSVDRLEGSDIGSLKISSVLGSNALAPIAFAGNVELSLANSLMLDTTRIVQLPAGATSLPANANGSASIGAPVVSLSAPYVEIGPVSAFSAWTPIRPVSAAGDGTLNINASFVDILNQTELDQVGQFNVTSATDIRLSSTLPNPNGSNALLPGELFTSGNVTFAARDVYPSTGSEFIIDAVGATDPTTQTVLPTNVTFKSNGASSAPLSAGGTLLIDATNIDQGGTVRAPSGTLILGVGDPTDANTLAQFNNLPIVATQNVTMENGSITSVSNDGAIIPFGTTVDGVEWQFNPVIGVSSAPDLTAPPAKYVGLNGANVALSAGASIDLSGGGDLQASEWVPGTGGTRNLLSQYNVSYASSAAGVAVPVNAGASNVYAILPGTQSPVAAYDPIYAQSLQPSKNNGTVSTTTVGIGVGDAALNGEVGQSVYLSGVPGLAPGVYTLLPAQYATLPGAYRVTLSTASGGAPTGASQVLPDGTVVTSGYFANSLTGSRSATPVLFNVQSSSVWQQYSQYTSTSANAFFSSLAITNGTVTPMLPQDAGQLVLSASQTLKLGARLDAAPAPGGGPAEVDIASRDIQVVGSGEAALPGYLQIDSSDLDALGAGSLLIGGTRTLTSTGLVITPESNSVVVSTDASHPLAGPEVILVTKTDNTGTDPNAANGLRVDAGSVIEAQGNYPAAKDVPITIGQVANASTGAPGISGDGALLSVSNGAPSVVTRYDTTGTGLLNVGDDVTLSGGWALTLDSSGNLGFSPTASLSGRTIAVDGSSITFVSDPATAGNLTGFVVGPTQIAQLGAAQNVILRSAGAMNFDGNLDIAFSRNVELSAGTFNGNGGNVTITGPQIELTNDVGATAATAIGGAGSLTVQAGELDLGGGTRSTTGFGSVAFEAASSIVAQGNGTFDIGASSVEFAAPVILADVGSNQAVTTTGVLNLNGASGSPLQRTAVGGAWTFTGGSVNVNGNIAAPAGNVTIEATSGDLTVGNGALISTAATPLQFFDVTLYGPAGAISLTADTGNIVLASGSTLDFAGASGGGNAGSLTVSAPKQSVLLGGTLEGSAAAGYLGGSFSLLSGGAVNLDELATELASSGINNSVSVQSNSGNLVLSAGNTLTAHSVSLIADGGTPGADTSNGAVQILGTINASGNAGGEIDLYGKTLVDVEGTLLAVGGTPGKSASGDWAPSSDVITPNERGGTINLGTAGTPDTVGGVIQIDPTYGYESVSSANSGTIVVGANALVDVSGGSLGGLSGGTVNFRVPLLAGGTAVNLDLPASFNTTQGKGIVGSRSTQVEAFAVWSTIDPSTGAKHFDGIVDPAGWFVDATSGGGMPAMVAGTWTDQTGSALPAPTTPDQLADYLANDIFTPAASSVNADHQSFYGYLTGSTSTPGTLMGFVQSGLNNLAINNAGSVPGLQVAPGIELDNPDSAINNGNISVVTNWNLGAGTSENALAFRFENTIAPIVTFRAENELDVKASLTDGFFQIANPIPVVLPDYAAAEAAYNTKYYGYAASRYGINASSSWTSGPAQPSQLGGTTEEQDAYYALYLAYAKFLGSAGPAEWSKFEVRPVGMLVTINSMVLAYQREGVTTSGLVPPLAPSAAQEQADPSVYTNYLKLYGAYVQKVVHFFVTNYYQYINAAAPLAFLPPPAVQWDTPTSGGGGSGGTDNTPSPLATQANRLALAAASVMGGNSASFRLVGGANITSSDPLSVQPASTFSGQENGSVVLDGHTSYVDSLGKQILVPTMVRTGAGSIEIASANDLLLVDPNAYANPQQYDLIPGAIYTVGTPVPGAPTSDTGSILLGGSGLPGYVSGLVANTQGGGDISILVQHDIQGGEHALDQTGAVTGIVQGDLAQFWWQWLELANPSNGVRVTQTTIDFGAFDQGILSVGGNVTVKAGGNISDLGVSLPTTWYQDANNNVITVGGGNLNVAAGGDIVSGTYFVANGSGTLTAGGAVVPDGLAYAETTAGGNVSINQTLGTLLATQSGSLSVTARQGAQIAGVFDPSYLNGGNLKNVYNVLGPDAQGYSASSSVSVLTTTGDVSLGQMNGAAMNMIGADGTHDFSYVLPASVSLSALTGGIDVASGGALYPSATGNLNLIAQQAINISSQGAGAYDGLTMLDFDASQMPSPTQQSLPLNLISDNDALNHTPTALHADDPNPVRIYSVDGSIIDGTQIPAGSANAGAFNQYVGINVGKVALIEAGQDIVNLSFQGQNLNDDDVTRIVAGRDILDTPFKISNAGIVVVPSILLGGPGTLDVEAGRNIGPLTNPAQVYAVYGGSNYPHTQLEGIQTVGNAYNPYLPHESAAIQVMFGIAPGADDAAFIANYINPATSLSDVPSSAQALVQFVEGYEGEQAETSDVQQAFAQFQSLPSYVQQLFINQVLFNILTQVGTDFHDPNSPYRGQYARGYAAINTLFPASMGYTANSLDGGSNGSGATVSTGNLDMRGTTIQTQQGGNISIVGPGGQALIGSSSAPPDVVDTSGNVIAGPGTAGVLTLEKGDINIFTDRSLLLAQSRVFTEQGGNMTIWSSNGDIDAGKGATTSADVPGPIYVCDVNHYCTLDARGEVTGAGIATLQTIPGALPGNVNLIAPRGTVDAGAAGIRVSGNLNIAALQVSNAANIQVKGTAIGVPGGATVNVASLTAATAAASVASMVAKDVAQRASDLSGRQWVVTVEVTGFGIRCRPNDKDCKK
ncbi:Filamentous haemagglutinin FhaB/tRNA nuclease CdiA-like TPS domain-containing protein [Pararobbsia alpina]|uniref:filamentous haemagglutinin family protein n=1 Tax=Pararobbsia alpina TaxID=621374 RepID=UPI0039A604B5